MVILALGTYTQPAQNIPASPGMALGRFFRVRFPGPPRPGPRPGGPPGAHKGLLGLQTDPPAALLGLLLLAGPPSKPESASASERAECLLVI